MKWAYGITTVPERRYNYLPLTIKSLNNAGFTHPTLFVDGNSGNYKEFGLETVHRSSKILAYGNWYLALLELWIRNPDAERFAIFQDDFVTYKNLRPFLEKIILPDDNYWNLLTFPENEARNPKQLVGWFASNQKGRGAVGLVFPHNLVERLLLHPMIVKKSKEKRNPHRSIDGAVVNSCANMGVKEMVHYPTLVYHIGDTSSIGNRQWDKPGSFKGEDFNALDFLQRKN